MKGKTVRILSIIVILIIVSFLSYSYFAKYNKKSNNNDNSGVTLKNFKYKMFYYEIPDGLTFSYYDDNKFEIEGNGWYVLVRPYYDKDRDVYYDNNLWYITGTKFDNKDIISNDAIEIDEATVLTFNRENTKSVLCAFATDYLYDYEVEIFNDNGEYDISPLNEIIESLLNATWNENEENTYHYDVIDFKESY